MDKQGRYIILLAITDNITYTIANIYAPNERLQHFLKKILVKLQ